MPNVIERWLQRGPDPSDSQARTTSGSEATMDLLRRTIRECSACHGSLDSHSYRFFACHPSSTADAAAFLQAIRSEDWATVQAGQMPALDQPLFVLYAIACPHPPQGSGMVALLRTQSDPQTPGMLAEQRALTPESLATLRAQCPTCTWIPFIAPLQFQHQPV
jgi:hypothetical protein